VFLDSCSLQHGLSLIHCVTICNDIALHLFICYYYNILFKNVSFTSRIFRPFSDEKLGEKEELCVDAVDSHFAKF